MSKTNDNLDKQEEMENSMNIELSEEIAEGKRGKFMSLTKLRSQLEKIPKKRILSNKGFLMSCASCKTLSLKDSQLTSLFMFGIFFPIIVLQK